MLATSPSSIATARSANSRAMRLSADAMGMRWPFFSMRKQTTGKDTVYAERGTVLRIHPSICGAPTVWDRDVVIYLGSLLRSAPNPTRSLALSAHQLLRATSRSTGVQGYASLMNALTRLRDTRITTNIGTTSRDLQQVSWLEGIVVERRSRGEGRSAMSGLTIVLSEWAFASLIRDDAVAISPDYFHLTGGLQRRLYELATSNCRETGDWAIGLRALAKECGSHQCNLRRFKFDLRDIIAAHPLPELSIRLEVDGDEDRVVFAQLPFGPVVAPLLQTTQDCII